MKLKLKLIFEQFCCFVQIEIKELKSIDKVTSFFLNYRRTKVMKRTKCVVVYLFFKETAKLKKMVLTLKF